MHVCFLYLNQQISIKNDVISFLAVKHFSFTIYFPEVFQDCHIFNSLHFSLYMIFIVKPEKPLGFNKCCHVPTLIKVQNLLHTLYRQA